MKKQLKKGDTCFLGKSEYTPRKIEVDATVIKVGRVYLYVESRDQKHKERFDKHNWAVGSTDYNSDYKLYENKQEYLDLKMMKELHSQLGVKFQWNMPLLKNLETYKQVCLLIGLEINQE